MKIGDYIARIESLYSKGAPSDDARLSRRYIYNKMLTVRDTLLFNKSNKKQKLNSETYQSFKVELIETPNTFNANLFNFKENKLMKSGSKLPKMTMRLDREQIEYVNDLESNLSLKQTEWQLFKYARANKYTSKLPVYFIKDGYLYVSAPKLIDSVEMSAVYFDPYEVANYLGLTYFILDLDFPIDEDLSDTLVEMCSKELILMFTQMQEDKNADGTDDSIIAPSASQTKARE